MVCGVVRILFLASECKGTTFLEYKRVIGYIFDVGVPQSTESALMSNKCFPLSETNPLRVLHQLGKSTEPKEP